ncbi:aminopeptidase N-like [Formica exsecta]|uniref:aminopeptidase N-like n=1 Tax=Formica exsecta TaxID=72781 RepID=UPI001144058D|nr:aminopeptidase N-like [Formica exsecta]
MLNGTLPRNSMLMGLNTYFNTRFPNFNSPTPDDLWSFIQTGIDDKLKNKLYNLSIKQIMDIWITQTYCPVVNVKRDYSDNLVKISKEINDKLDRKPYFIPVSYVKETNINFVNISLQSFNCLTQSNPEMKINYDSKDKWFMANILQTGYYRVNYDTENWRMIARYLKSKKYENIHVINRAQIIDDAFHLAMEKKLDFSIFWELASYLKQEKDYVAWYPMIKVFERISSVFAITTTHDEHLKEIKIKIGSLFEKAENDMYNQTEANITNNVLNKYLKQELTKWGCLINNPLCMQMAKEQFEWHLSDPETRKLLPGWKKLISCNGLKTANYSVWFSAWTNALNVYKEKSDYEMLKFSSSCSDHPRKYFHLLFIQRSSQTMITDFETSTRKKEHSYALIADIYLSMLAMQAKNPTLLKDILDLPNLNSIKNSRISTIATLIVIINNVYSKNELDMITEFAQDMPQLVSKCIECKIKSRLLEIQSQIKFYQTMIKLPPSRLITSTTTSSTTTRPTTPPTIILRNESINNPRLRFMG